MPALHIRPSEDDPASGPARPAGPVRLVRVRQCEAHEEALYLLLVARTHGISHVEMPSMSRHRRFVRQHPYRVWYLIRSDREWVGSAYLLPSNSVGISMLEGFDDRIGDVLTQLFAKHRPLPAVASVRSGVFSFNVSPANARLISALTALGADLVQQTYVLPDGAVPAGGDASSRSGGVANDRTRREGPPAPGSRPRRRQ